MHLIQKILEADLLRYKNAASLPLFIEVPSKKEFLPSVVSASRPDKFLESNRLTPESSIRVGVFSYDGAHLDDMLVSLFDTAYQISSQRAFGNIFKSVKEASSYIKKTSGLSNFPQQVIYPKSLSDNKLNQLGAKIDSYGSALSMKWNPTSVSRIVILSRPDFVGVFHSLGRDHYSVLLHNLRLGLAFVEVP